MTISRKIYKIEDKLNYISKYENIKKDFPKKDILIIASEFSVSIFFFKRIDKTKAIFIRN